MEYKSAAGCLDSLGKNGMSVMGKEVEQNPGISPGICPRFSSKAMRTCWLVNKGRWAISPGLGGMDDKKEEAA